MAIGDAKKPGFFTSPFTYQNKKFVKEISRRKTTKKKEN